MPFGWPVTGVVERMVERLQAEPLLDAPPSPIRLHPPVDGQVVSP